MTLVWIFGPFAKVYARDDATSTRNSWIARKYNEINESTSLFKIQISPCIKCLKLDRIFV